MTTLAVIPVLVGPLQVLIALLPALLIALGTTVIALLKPSTMLKLLKLLWWRLCGAGAGRSVNSGPARPRSKRARTGR
jgi:hypothetical protein